MKQLVADKLGVSLLGELNKSEEDTTRLSSSVLGNLDGEGRPIDDCKRTHVCLYCSETSCRICSQVYKIFWIPSSPKLGYSTSKSFLNNVLKLLKKGNKQLTSGRIMKDPWSRLAPEVEVSAFWVTPARAIWIKEPYVNLEMRLTSFNVCLHWLLENQLQTVSQQYVSSSPKLGYSTSKRF